MDGNQKVTPNQVRSLLTRVFDSYNRKDFLSSDPLSVVHDFKEQRDQEVVAFITSLFSYGNASQIVKTQKGLFQKLGTSPHEYLYNFSKKREVPAFYYRFHKKEHLQVLFLIIQKVLEKYHSLEGLFTEGLEYSQDGQDSNVEKALILGVHRIRKIIEELKVDPSLHRGFRFLFNTPAEKSACKRLVMFFRWMVRKDDLDRGIWTKLQPQDLVIPVDTHICKISYYLNLRKGQLKQAPNWKMALEITRNLRAFDSKDPVRFDFSLTRIGILGSEFPETGLKKNR